MYGGHHHGHYGHGGYAGLGPDGRRLYVGTYILIQALTSTHTTPTTNAVVSTRIPTGPNPTMLTVTTMMSPPILKIHTGLPSVDPVAAVLQAIPWGQPV